MRLAVQIAMGRVFVLRSVRVFYKKTGRMKFISHLDMTRFMSRLLAKSKIPVWYTEGFNRHIYMNFAVPLSLGFEGLYEILEIRIIDDNFSNEDCLGALKRVTVEGIEFLSVCDQKQNMKDIGFAEFKLRFDESVPEGIEEFLKSESILCEKKGKKGKIKQIDLIPKINSFKIEKNILTLTLVAGNEDNLNPSLVMDTFFEKTNNEPMFYSVTRTVILNKQLEIFE